MQLFENVPLAPEDPIFGLNAAFLTDPRPHKVNLGIGSYKTQALRSLILSSVRQAEMRLFEEEKDKEYLPIAGDERFCRETARLLFGELAEALSARAFWAQTIGGEGALRLIAELLARFDLASTIYIPDPTWINHRPTFAAAGLRVETYPYYDPVKRELDFDRLMAAIERMPAGAALLLHGCCHNPSGMDPDEEQWREIARAACDRGLLPVLDVAYQGFGEGLKEDAAGVRQFARHFPRLAVAYSFSKNMGLYGERTGALCFVCDTPGERDCAGSQIKTFIRTLYSNPPRHGARVARMILQTDGLRLLWEEELEGMRRRILDMRAHFADCLRQTQAPFDASELQRQKGMFGFLPLTAEQCARLQDERAIYLPATGRINVAGLCPDNSLFVAEAIAAVMREG